LRVHHKTQASLRLGAMSIIMPRSSSVWESWPWKVPPENSTSSQILFRNDEPISYNGVSLCLGSYITSYHRFRCEPLHQSAGHAQNQLGWCHHRTLSKLLECFRVPVVQLTIQSRLLSSDMSQICAVTCTALVLLDLGAGVRASYDRAELGPSISSRRLKLNNIVQPFFIMAFSLPKVALAIILVRTKQARRWQAWVLYSLTSSQMVSAIVAIILDLVRCLPIQATSNPGLSGRCGPYKLFIIYRTFLRGKTHLLVAVSNAWKTANAGHSLLRRYRLHPSFGSYQRLLECSDWVEGQSVLVCYDRLLSLVRPLYCNEAPTWQNWQQS